MNTIGQVKTPISPGGNQGDSPINEQASYKHWDVVVLPENLADKIFSYQNFKDICRCRQVSRSWLDVIDTFSLPARAFFRDYSAVLPFLHRQHTGEYDYGRIRGRLQRLGDVGKRSVQLLDGVLANQHPFFRQTFCYALSTALVETQYFSPTRPAYTIQRHDRAGDICLSADGGYLASAPEWKNPFRSPRYSTITMARSIAGTWHQQDQIQLDYCVQQFGFSPGGHYFAAMFGSLEYSSMTVAGYRVLSSAHRVQVWQSVNGTWKAQLKLSYPDPDAVAGFRFSPCQQYLAIASCRFTIFKHSDGEWRRHQEFAHRYDDCAFVVFSPDQQYLLAGWCYHQLELFQHVGSQWQEQRLPIKLKCRRFLPPCFSPSGRHFATVTLSCRDWQIWGRVDGVWQQQHALCTPSADLYLGTIHFCPDGNLMVPYQDNTLEIWETNRSAPGTWRKKADLAIAGEWHAEQPIAINPDKEHFATYSGNMVTVWALVDDQFLGRGSIVHPGQVSTINFSCDGQHLVTGSKDGTAKICWQVDGTWQEKQSIRHSSGVGTAQLGPNGDYLLTTCPEDGTVNMWAPWKVTSNSCGDVIASWTEP